MSDSICRIGIRGSHTTAFLSATAEPAAAENFWQSSCRGCAVHCFGNIVDVQVLAGKKTDLSIEYPDYYSVLITHESGHHGTFAVDVVCRKAVRYFEVYGENLYLTWDGTADGLRIYDTDNKEEHMIDFYEQTDHLPGYNSMIIENAYEDEIIDFFETAEHGKKQMYSFEQDKTILNWIDRIESYV